MAVQIDCEELKGCKSYFGWIAGKIRLAQDDWNKGIIKGTVSEDLCRLMFATDYYFEVDADEIRARDATDLRKVYAEEVGSKAGKNEREIDRIWKSVHGKCSVLELIFGMCVRLDEMVNEGEAGEMIGDFFRILCKNVGFSEDGKLWEGELERLMKREYNADGSGGGLFPLQKWSQETGKDQRKVSIWYQMNTWLDENLDDEAQFSFEKFVGNG